VYSFILLFLNIKLLFFYFRNKIPEIEMAV